MITKDDLRQINKAFKKSPVAHVRKMINKKYTLTILIHIWLLKQHRFGQLKTIRTMNSKTLTLTLRDMVKNELIRKKIYQISPKTTKYFITQKGKALLRVYMHMINFSMQYYPKEILVDEKPKKIEELFSKDMLRAIKQNLKNS